MTHLHRGLGIDAAFIIIALFVMLIWGSYLSAQWLKHKAPLFLRDATTSLVVLLIIAGACLSFKGGVFTSLFIEVVVASHVVDLLTRYTDGKEVQTVYVGRRMA
jgi:hypothetical protein